MVSRLRLGFLIVFLGLPANLFADDRLALVIGNAKYEGDAALRNPANDADAISAALTKLDFKVTQKTDLDLAQFEDAVVAFRKSLTKKSVAFFFYAGHGVQVKGDNFLVPVGARLKEEFQVKEKCYKLDQILSALDESEAALKVVILDCCRDNPFTRGWTRGGPNPGLASISDIPDGTIIAFATAPGKTALDSALGARGNSPYTTQLVASLNSRPAEGLEVTEALREASRAVKLHTGQVPWLNLDASLDKYYLWRNSEVATTTKPKLALKPGEPTPPNETITGEKSYTNSIKMKFVLIPAGKFTMGSPATELSTDRSGPPPKGPAGRLLAKQAHDPRETQIEVTLTKSFYLGRTEVTQGQWEAIMGTDPWNAKQYVKVGAEFPATYISWDDAQEFCKKLSAKEGKLYRLPSEAEWEYACRGGTTTAFSFGKDATDLREHAWFDENGGNYPREAGKKKENPLGLFDMHGNVFEWCEDHFSSRLIGGRDPVLYAGGTVGVARGGCFMFGAEYCRSASRYMSDHSSRRGSIGFRVVLDSSK